MSYLENNICTFEPLQDIDYSQKKDIISCSLFRIRSGGYKNFMRYLNGIGILNDVAKDNNMEVRLFIDESIKNDDKTMKFLKKYSHVKLIVYKCCNFLVDGIHHCSVFGTLVRFFPMFKFPNNDARAVLVADADTKTQYIGSLVSLLNTLKKNNLDRKLKMAYNGRFFHVNISGNNIPKMTHNDKTYFFPYCIAQKIIGLRKIPNKPFVKFIKKLTKYMDEVIRPKKILSDYIITPDKYKIKCENNICFGVDEYFINRILIKYLLKKDMPFCYNNLYDAAQFYFFKHPNNYNSEVVDIPCDEYKNIFYEYMDETSLIKYSCEEIDKNIYTPDVIEETDKQTIANPFMEMYAKKLLPFLEKLDEKKDYRIYSESQIYSMKQVDYKTYFKIKYIRFVNFDQKDLVLGSTVFENKLKI